MKKRVHLLYTGNVQGVGFRLTVENIADRYGVRGWVKNLRNGQVEVIAEADEDRLKSFLEQINQGFLSNIQNVEFDWQQATDEFKGFGIKV